MCFSSSRLTNKKMIDRKRRQALKDTPKANPGNSLDEYPFASTQQGGSGAKVAEVPVTEQNRQGGKMSSFYQNNNVGDLSLIHI